MHYSIGIECTSIRNNRADIAKTYYNSKFLSNQNKKFRLWQIECACSNKPVNIRFKIFGFNTSLYDMIPKSNLVLGGFLNMPFTILIIDDEEKLRSLLARIIKLEGYIVSEAPDLRSELKILNKESIDVVLCDVKLPDGNGVDFVKEVRSRFPLIEIILLTAYGNIPDGVQAIKNGAFDYILKGDDNDKIIPLLSQAVNRSNQNKRSAIKIKDKGTYSFDDIIGNS